MNIYKKELNLAEVGIAFVMSFLLSQALIFFATLIINIILVAMGYDATQVETLLSNSPWIYGVLSLASQLGFVAIFIYYYRKKLNKSQVFAGGFKVDGKRPFYVTKNGFDILQALIYMVIGVATIYALSASINLVQYAFNAMGYKESGMPFEINSVRNLLIGIFTFGIVPPIAEELLFRGIIFSGLKKYGPAAAIFGSAAMFAIFHLSAEQLVYPFLFGILLAIVMWKTRNVVYCMLIHGANNLMSIFTQYIYRNEPTVAFEPSAMIIIVALVLLGVWGFGMYALYKANNSVIKNAKETDITKLILEATPEELTAEQNVQEEIVSDEKKKKYQNIFLACTCAMVVLWILLFSLKF